MGAHSAARAAAARLSTGGLDLEPAERALPAMDVPAAIGAGDALRGLARSIRSRYTGALAFEDDTGIRRVVFRDGDFVTAASGIEAESLVGFLGQRGDLSPDAARLARKLPQFGRHAGAALIAHGHLRQEELWTVLRAHAEWILARIVAMTRGAASVEKQVPPRLQGRALRIRRRDGRRGARRDRPALRDASRRPGTPRRRARLSSGPVPTRRCSANARFPMPNRRWSTTPRARDSTKCWPAPTRWTSQRCSTR